MYHLFWRFLNPFMIMFTLLCCSSLYHYICCEKFSIPSQSLLFSGWSIFPPLISDHLQGWDWPSNPWPHWHWPPDQQDGWFRGCRLDDSYREGGACWELTWNHSGSEATLKRHSRYYTICLAKLMLHLVCLRPH